MRLVYFSLFVALSLASVAQAQSISQNLPGYGSSPLPDVSTPAPAATPNPTVAPADPFTVTDVTADVTADSATHARDQALMQAERAAYVQLCSRMNVPESAAKLNDNGVAALVQSFDLQSEKVSALRYIGVFTIRFKPQSVQRKLGKYVPAGADANGNLIPGGSGVIVDAKPGPAGPVSHLPVAVQTGSLAAWTQIKRRLTSMPQVVRVDTIDLGRGVSHMDLLYSGSVDDLQTAMSGQGFVLLQGPMGDWELADGSMVPR
jgi:hypothetical protein